VLLVVFRLVAAILARELVVIEVEVSYAERGLQVPVLVQEPLVSVADAYACSPALATLVLEVENLQVGEVIGDKGYVKPQEMPLE
jgi:hypothetical protein